LSLQRDAEECLLAAIADNNGVDVPPELMGDVKPSDNRVGAGDGKAWRKTLADAAAKLRMRQYPTGQPSLEKANSLLNKVLLESQAYLEALSRPTSATRHGTPGKPPSAIGKLLLWGGTGAAVGALAAAIHYFLKRR